MATLDGLKNPGNKLFFRFFTLHHTLPNYFFSSGGAEKVRKNHSRPKHNDTT